MKLCKKCTHKNLIDSGFYKYNNGDYKIKFPLYKNNNRTLIELHIVVSIEENHVYTEVLDICNNSYYIPYYNDEYSKNNKVCRIVKRRVNEIINTLKETNIIC